MTTGGATVAVADVEPAPAPAARGDVVVVGAAAPDLGQVVAAAVSTEADVDRSRRRAHADLAGPGTRPRLWFHVDRRCP